MRTNYLNRAAKHNLLILIMLEQYIEPTIKSFDSFVDNRIVADLKRAKTYIKKSREAILNAVDKHELQATLRMLKSNTIEVIPKTSISEIREDLGESADNAMLDLACVILDEKCDTCKCEDVEHCRIRKAFLDFDVPVFKTEVAEGDCPYKED